MRPLFTQEQEEFIKNNVFGIGNSELLELVNNKFGMNVNLSQLMSYKANHHLSSGLDGRFEKGREPFNKGKYGVNGWSSTRFKKGQQPKTYKPIGSERINSTGYVVIKVSDPDKWKMKHVFIWENLNGPIPNEHVVIFGDGDKHNFDPNNLVLVSRKQLAVMNKNGLIKQDAELTKTGKIIADLKMKINDRKKKTD